MSVTAAATASAAGPTTTLSQPTSSTYSPAAKPSTKQRPRRAGRPPSSAPPRLRPKLAMSDFPARIRLVAGVIVAAVDGLPGLKRCCIGDPTSTFILTVEGGLEVPQPLADRAAHLRQPLRPQHHQRDHQDDDQLQRTHVRNHCSRSPRSVHPTLQGALPRPRSLPAQGRGL